MASQAAVRSGLSWQSASVVAQALMQVVVLAVLARLLEPEDFGLLAMANVAIAFGQLLSEAGAGAAVVQRQKPVDHSFISAAFLLSIGVGIVFLVIQVAIAPWLEAYFGMEGLRSVLIALSAVFVILGTGRVCEALLQRELKFPALMKINFAAQLFGYAVPAILLAWAGYGVWALVGGTLGQALLRTLLYALVTRGGFGLSTSMADIREVATFGAGITKIKFWNYVMQQGDRFIIGRRLDADALGQYQIITQLASMPVQYLGDVLDAVFFPVMSRMQNDPVRRTEAYLLLAIYSFAFMFGLGVFLAVNAETIILLILGERWLPTVALFQIFSLGAGFRILARIGDIVNRALGQILQAALRKMVLAIVLIAAVWLAVPYGLFVICATLVCVQLFGALLISDLACRGLGMKWHDATAGLRIAVVGVSMIIIINGAILLSKYWFDLSGWAVLSISTTTHLVAAGLFFQPLLKLWRQDEPVHQLRDAN